MILIFLCLVDDNSVAKIVLYLYIIQLVALECTDEEDDIAAGLLYDVDKRTVGVEVTF